MSNLKFFSMFYSKFLISLKPRREIRQEISGVINGYNLYGRTQQKT
jgi:hypothetical protein